MEDPEREHVDLTGDNPLSDDFDEETQRRIINQRLKDHSPGKGVRFNILVTVMEVGGAIALFHLARRAGASNTVAYLVGSIGPVIGGILIWVRARKFSGASAAIFAFTALSAVIAFLGSTSPKALLYKDAATTALIGLIFFGSCVFHRRPIAFYMAQRWGTDGSHEGMQTFDVIWSVSSDFRRGMYVITCLWGGLFLAQSAIVAWIISQSTYSTAYNFDQILPLVFVGIGVAGSVAVGRSLRRKGEQRSSPSTQ